MLREITLTLPYVSKDTYWHHTARVIDLDRTAHAALKCALLDAAGGFTEVEATGYWKDDNGALCAEPVRRYIVAVDGPSAALECIKALIRAGCTKGEQCVYYTQIDGTAHIVDCPKD